MANRGFQEKFNLRKARLGTATVINSRIFQSFLITIFIFSFFIFTLSTDY